MSELLKKIDARAKLAGTNKLELLLFSLGTDTRTNRRETYGINVFKVREVMRTPPITRAPEMPASVEGMVSLRGTLVPVVDLAKYVGISIEAPPEIMIVTEYNGHTQAFLVEAVDTILRLDWSAMRVPPTMLAQQSGGTVIAVTELEDGRLVMMLDVERVLADTHQADDEILYRNLQPIPERDRMVLFADDSSIARKQIERTLEAIDVKYVSTVNGRQAWEELVKLADFADSQSKRVSDVVQLLLTDVEMPEMDGYMLTKKVRSDPRMSDLQIIMHSSLSSNQNQQLGQSVGVDEYVSKFQPQRLAEALSRRLKYSSTQPA